MGTPKWPGVGVGAVAIRDGAILLIRRARPPSEGLWSLPGGRVEWLETMADALRRETREETGLNVDIERIAGVVERLYPPDEESEGFHYVIVDYFVTVAGGKLRAGDDALDARWIPLVDIDTFSLAPGLAETLEDFGV